MYEMAFVVIKIGTCQPDWKNPSHNLRGGNNEMVKILVSSLVPSSFSFIRVKTCLSSNSI